MYSQQQLFEIKSVVDKFYDKNPSGVLVLRWATATGKTSLSVSLAENFPMEVISSDSRQVFRYMDIWTDKVSSCIRSQFPHYLIDVVDPDMTYTAGQRNHDAFALINDIQSRGKLPWIVGGTGLYIDTVYKNFSMPSVEPDLVLRKELEERELLHPWSLWEELSRCDPCEAEKLGPRSIRYIVRALEIYYKSWYPKSSYLERKPPRRPLLLLGLRRDKDDTNILINQRVRSMLQSWLIDETQWLLEQWYHSSLQSMQGIWYKQTVDYLQDHNDFDRLEKDIQHATHHLAKKQRSWFRRYIADAKVWYENVSYYVIYLS